MGLEKEEFPLGDGKNAAAFVSRIIGRKFLENFAQISGALSTRSRSHSCPNELLLLFASLADYIAGWLAQLSPIDRIAPPRRAARRFDQTPNIRSNTQSYFSLELVARSTEAGIRVYRGPPLSYPPVHFSDS